MFVKSVDFSVFLFLLLGSVSVFSMMKNPASKSGESMLMMEKDGEQETISDVKHDGGVDSLTNLINLIKLSRCDESHLDTYRDESIKALKGCKGKIEKSLNHVCEVISVREANMKEYAFEHGAMSIKLEAIIDVLEDDEELPKNELRKLRKALKAVKIKEDSSFLECRYRAAGKEDALSDADKALEEYADSYEKRIKVIDKKINSLEENKNIGFAEFVTLLITYSAFEVKAKSS